MLIVDNYDSFTYNIVEYVKICGIQPVVIKNNEKSLDEISELNFRSIIISPGFGRPENAAVSKELINRYYNKLPILGVCLGHQCIAECFGAKITELKEPCHGKTSKIYFDDTCPLYTGMKQGFSAVRYHSLTVDKRSCNTPIKINAETKNGDIMGIGIENTLVYGVQFHPEGILTENGIQIIKNFINIGQY